MLKQERHKVIMDLIRQQQNVKVAQLKQLFGVSDETVRRDLVVLENQGLLRCVHGGAVYESPTTNEYRVEVRIKSNQMEKEAICEEAAKLVKDGEAIAIGGSTTTLALGSFLAGKNNLTVVTNSLFLANQVGMNETNKVILTGGRLWPDQQKMMGSLTLECFLKYRVDKTFFSVAGVNSDDGLTEYRENETAVTQALLRIGRCNILLNDTSKFHTVALCHVADLSAVHQMVTDWHTSLDELESYEEMGIQVHRAYRR